MYFAPTQKSEFLTIKGMFIAKLGHTDEANEAFVAAVQMDLGFAKAWAEWGRFNDRQFKANPTNSSLAANAVSCYLQAAGLYKNRKSRKLVVRVLWLLSLDDATTSEISRAFESYKGEMAIWYWITLVPQLLLSLSHRESRHARSILMRIAKMYPQVRCLLAAIALMGALTIDAGLFFLHSLSLFQALFYQLRTANEDFRAVKRSTHSSHLAKRATRQNAEAAAAAAASTPAAGASSTASANGSDAAAAPTPKGEGDASDSPVSGPGAAPATPAAPSIVPPSPNVATPDPPAATATAPAATQGPPNPGSIPKQPFELVEEILNILKTAGPLLSLSMEKMVDQIHTRGKSPTEEDIYRFITALLVDAMQVSHSCGFMSATAWV
jgi:transformation/transcription domain-associated protein